VTSVLIVLGVGFESRPVVGAGYQRNEGERELGEVSYGNRRERANERGGNMSPAGKKKRKEKGKRGKNQIGSREKERKRNGQRRNVK
jgi:hypothetical protein